MSWAEESAAKKIRDQPNNDVRIVLKDAQEVIPFVWVIQLLLGSQALYSFWREVPLLSDRCDDQQKDLNLSQGLYTSDEIMVLHPGRLALTKGCVISSHSIMDSDERALVLTPVLTSFAVAVEDDWGIC